MMSDTPHRDSRSEIFASIRENLAKSKPFDKQIESEGIVRPVAPNDKVDLLEEFRVSLESVGAKYALVESEDGAADALQAIVADLSATEITVSDSALVHRIVNAAELDAISDPSRGELFASDVGITSAQWAIAETGTLVLEAGAERHRLVSLVPAVHICLLKASSILRTMNEILAALDTEVNPSITFITGASRTSDIELTLAIGVHGPGELYVIVIKDQ